MKKQDRIAMYKMALRDYTICKYLPFLKSFYRTEDGLCYYFIKLSINWQLPELKEAYYEIYKHWPYAWWFKIGEIKPRIEILKKAIELAENKTEKEEAILLGKCAIYL